MKIKLFALSICIISVFSLSYASSNDNTTDYMTKSERQALSGFFQKMQTCQNAQVKGNTMLYKVYKNGNFCIYEESNKQKGETMTFTLIVAKTYAKIGLELNKKILNNTDIKDPFSDKVLMESIVLSGKYCK